MLYITSGLDFRALLARLDWMAAEYGLELLVHTNEATAASSRCPLMAAPLRHGCIQNRQFNRSGMPIPKEIAGNFCRFRPFA
jgi:hypothetical protein